MLQKIVLASNNPGKLREFGALISPLGISLVPQGTLLGVTEAEEPYATFVENALAKARHASAGTGLPALADDSGLCVPALNGAPGVYSARYAALAGKNKTDAANNAHLIEQLHALPAGSSRRAYYYCVLVLIRHEHDPQPVIAEGRWEGEIVDIPRGTHGFGYDPHFLIPALDQTAAELAPELKNELSHRARALRHLLEKLGQTA